MPTNAVVLTPPAPTDGLALWRLANQAGRLDVNAPYAYLVWCRDFAATTVLARADDEVVGFVTGYRRPRTPNHLFVWQVAVHPDWRGRRLASSMLDELVTRDVNASVDTVEATVMRSNDASMRTFERFARRWKADMRRDPLFDASLFPAGHETEILLTIGPLPRGSPSGPVTSPRSDEARGDAG